MIVYTITNNVTDDVWVGTCKDSSDERFMQFQEAMALGIKAQIYKDLRDFGIDNFTVEDFAVAHDREELKDIFEEAMETYDGKSLVGVKTSLGKTSIAKSLPIKKTVKRTIATPAKNTIRSMREDMTKPGPVRSIPVKAAKEKVSSGRTNNSVKEKLIKEKMAEEKANRASLKSRQVMEQADEMAAILAGLDARGSTLRKK